MGRAGAWGQLAILVVSLATALLELALVPTLFPSINQSLALGLSALGVITAANRFVGAACSPAWMWLARRWSRKAVLVVASGAWGGWAIAAGFSTGTAMLLVLTSILSAGLTGLTPVITEILADLFDDRSRGRAVGIMYGCVGLLGSAAGSAIGQLAAIEDGWRIGFWISGTCNLAVGAAILAFFRDPGLGAAEPGIGRPGGMVAGVQGRAALATMFRVRSFKVLLASRLLSGHLVIASFGIAFLSGERRFPDHVATLVLAPFGVGYVVGAVGGALVADWAQARWPRTARVVLLQSAQFAFAAMAWLAIQPDWSRIETYMVLWAGLGVLQGVNPSLNRPIVMAVTPPALRGWAFVVMLTLVEAFGWAVYNLAAGWFGERYGLRDVLVVFTVWFMVANGIVLGLLYRSYGADVDRVRHAAQHA